jgi:hypothetical protein
MMVEGTLILRPSSTNGCLVWLLKFFHEKWLICFTVEKPDIRVHVGCAVVFDSDKHRVIFGKFKTFLLLEFKNNGMSSTKIERHYIYYKEYR